MTTGIFSQNVDEALRYSQVFYNGTARFMGMGGAFTALGGDLSALSQNPAGLGLFRSSEISISPQLFNFKSNTKFNDNLSQDYLYDFALSQAGIALNLINNNSETGLINLNFGYSFNKTNNLNQSIVIEGISESNTSRSLADYWAYISEGYTKLALGQSSRHFDAFLANSVLVIDTLSGFSDSYGTMYSYWGDSLPSIYGQTIKRIITSNGYTGEHALSIGANFSNMFFLGLTLGISRLNFENRYEHLEVTDKDLPSGITDFTYTYYYKDNGTGYSLKMGAIFKPIEPLRIGIAFHSPTYFKIDEYVNDNITAHRNGSVYQRENYPTRYSYALTTPFRVMAGGAYQLKKIAVISAEYEFVNYGSAKFSETGDNFDYTGRNDTIKSTLGPAHNFRIGTEVRLGKLYFRGGYGHYGKAFKNGDINDNIDYDTYSAGIGFREQNIFIDFAYTGLINPQKYILYQYGTDPGVVTAMSSMNLKRNMFTVTFGYKFNY